MDRINRALNHDWPVTVSEKNVDELLAQLVVHLTNLLNPRGFLLESRSAAGLVFRREPRSLFYLGLGLVILGLLSALGGEPLALLIAMAGAPLLWLRRPASLVVDLASDRGSTEVRASGPKQAGVEEAIQAAAAR